MCQEEQQHVQYVKIYKVYPWPLCVKNFQFECVDGIIMNLCEPYILVSLLQFVSVNFNSQMEYWYRAHTGPPHQQQQQQKQILVYHPPLITINH